MEEFHQRLINWLTFLAAPYARGGWISCSKIQIPLVLSKRDWSHDVLHPNLQWIAKKKILSEVERPGSLWDSGRHILGDTKVGAYGLVD